MLLGFIVILFYIAACAPAQKESTTPLPSPAKTVTTTQPSTTQTAAGISAEVKSILDISKTRVKSINYKYTGTPTGTEPYDFSVKDTKIKYVPPRGNKGLDLKDSYDTVFIDTVARTAQTYCLAAYCAYPGKKQNLNYADAYIPTIFDWVTGITSAKKIDEEVLDGRNVWKIETNKGIAWVDTYYGLPLQVQYGGNEYRFQQLAVNSVTDANVVPS